jgi:hypothetical protein
LDNENNRPDDVLIYLSTSQPGTHICLVQHKTKRQHPLSNVQGFSQVQAMGAMVTHTAITEPMAEKKAVINGVSDRWGSKIFKDVDER